MSSKQHLVSKSELTWSTLPQKGGGQNFVQTLQNKPLVLDRSSQLVGIPTPTMPITAVEVSEDSPLRFNLAMAPRSTWEEAELYECVRYARGMRRFNIREHMIEIDNLLRDRLSRKNTQDSH